MSLLFCLFTKHPCCSTDARSRPTPSAEALACWEHRERETRTDRIVAVAVAQSLTQVQSYSSPHCFAVCPREDLKAKLQSSAQLRTRGMGPNRTGSGRPVVRPNIL